MTPGRGSGTDAEDPSFEVHPSVLFRLGEELIQDEFQAISELVKNSYDANASVSRVSVSRSEEGPGGRGILRVSDTGEGMSEAVLRSAFLTLADSPKRRAKSGGSVPKGSRTPLGDKGLGRLGAQRLGSVLAVRTRPGQPGGPATLEHQILIDWSEVAKAKRLRDVRFPISTRRCKSGEMSGTDLEVSGLRNLALYDLSNRRELQGHLVRLVSPFGPTRGFRVSVTIDDDPVDLYGLTQQVLEAAVLRYRISYDNGQLQATGEFSSRFFFGTGSSQEDRRAREALNDDGGQSFIAHVNRQSRGAPFEYHANTRWFASRTLEARLEDLAPELLAPSISAEASMEDETDWPIADPGPFKSEVHMVFVNALGGGDRDIELRDYVRDAGGIRIYREGFAINVPRDWLGLDQGSTSAPSSYGLRSGNVLGYVDLTVDGNAGLVEATDREAFVAGPHLTNFERLFHHFASWADSSQTTLRRQFKVYGTRLLDKEGRALSSDDALRTLTRQGKSQQRARAAVASARAKAESATLGADPALTSALDQVSTYLDESEASEAQVAVLRQELASLREQLVLTHEAVAVGLSAESLAHEVVSIADRLAGEARRARKRGRWSPDDARHLADAMEAGARSLSKQASYLSPTLRYRREDRGPIRLGQICANAAQYHSERMASRHILVTVDCRADFEARVNQGRMTQVLDNLILNSEYWILDHRKRRRGQQPAATIMLTVDKPRVIVRDDGPGISPDSESSIFDAFVTTKPRGTGRGLGLFIVRQLLEYTGGTIELGPSLNKDGRRDSFQIDLGGALK